MAEYLANLSLDKSSFIGDKLIYVLAKESICSVYLFVKFCTYINDFEIFISFC